MGLFVNFKANHTMPCAILKFVWVILKNLYENFSLFTILGNWPLMNLFFVQFGHLHFLGPGSPVSGSPFQGHDFCLHSILSEDFLSIKNTSNWHEKIVEKNPWCAWTATAPTGSGSGSTPTPPPVFPFCTPLTNFKRC